ncbi:MAG: GerMN domain-containing protein [Acidobacteria bacterium]|jgi:hypothetical protein|nr:GerMN domain-containing protein [Acidobacteriota bacterium]
MVPRRHQTRVSLTGLFCAALLLFACGRGAEKAQPAKPAAGGAEPAALGESPASAVTLLYPDAVTGLLTPCFVKMSLKGEAQQDMARVAGRYIEGPTCDGQSQPFLQGTSLRGLFLLDGGLIVLDLTASAASGGGSDTENARVYGLIDTLCYNFKEIKSARVLVDGREVETLLGHLDLSRPLPPEWGLAAPGLMPVEPPPSAAPPQAPAEQPAAAPATGASQSSGQ